MQHLVGIAQILHPFLRAVAGREGVQIDGVAVIPAHELLIDRLGIVGHRAVVLAGVPDFVQRLRQLDHVGDLIAGVALIDIGQGLVVDVLIHSRGVDHVIVHHIIPPVRPVVGLEGDLHVLAVERNGLGDVACPCRAVADLGAPQRVEVVERTGAIFRHPKRLMLRQPCVHFGGRLGARCELEFQLHAINRQLFARLGDLVARRKKRHCAGGLPHADALRQLAGDAGGQQDAVLIIATAAHALTGVDVFLHGVLRKARRRDYGNFAAGKLLLDGKRLVRPVLRSHHSGNSAKMVHMGVGNDDGLDREFAEILFNELHSSLTALYAHQRVKDNPARVALDNGEVCHIIAAHLIDAVGHLEKPIDMVVFCILPQAGVYAVGRFFVVFQKRKGVLTPEDSPVLVLQLQRFRRVDQAARGKFVFLFVVEVELIVNCGI